MAVTLEQMSAAFARMLEAQQSQMEMQGRLFEKMAESGGSSGGGESGDGKAGKRLELDGKAFQETKRRRRGLGGMEFRLQGFGGNQIRTDWSGVGMD